MINLPEVGFEPIPAKWLVSETSALDHLAIVPVKTRYVLKAIF